MTLAIVNVLPEPVTPSSAWCGFPASTPAVNFSMACPWSPQGLKGASSLNEGITESS